MVRKCSVYILCLLILPILCILTSSKPVIGASLRLKPEISSSDSKSLSLDNSEQVDVIKNFIEAVKMRDAVKQREYFSEDLRKKSVDYMENVLKGHGIGFSSPWVSDFQIISSEKISNDKYSIDTEFILATSTGIFGKNNVKFTILKENGKWVISEIHTNDFMKPYIALPESELN